MKKVIESFKKTNTLKAIAKKELKQLKGGDAYWGVNSKVWTNRSLYGAGATQY